MSGNIDNEHPLMVKFRNDCLTRGAAGIKNLARLWGQMDDSGDKQLSMEEFVRNVQNHNIKLTKDQSVELFKAMDTDGTGTVDFNEFLKALRPPLNQFRLNLINLAFQKLDKTKDSKITVEDLKNVYNVSKHPKFINGQLTEAQCLRQFLDSFDIAQHADGVVTYDEFVLYYAGVSASVDSDGYFDVMMRQCWKL